MADTAKARSVSLEDVFRLVESSGFVTLDDAMKLGLTKPAFKYKLLRLMKEGRVRRWKRGRVTYYSAGLEPPVKGAKPLPLRRATEVRKRVVIKEEIMSKIGDHAATLKDIAGMLNTETSSFTVLSAVKELVNEGKLERVRVSKRLVLYVRSGLDPIEKVVEYYLSRVVGTSDYRGIVNRVEKNVEDSKVRSAILSHVIRSV